MQIVAPETLVVVENSGKQRIIVPGNNQTAFMCNWLKLRWLAELMVFAELKRQLDATDADIVLVNKRLDEAHDE